MSQNRTIRAILALDYDKRALSGTQKAIDQLNTSLDATRKRALTVETAASGLKKELAELARQDAIEQIGRDFARAGQDGRAFNASVRETVSRLRAVGASESEIRSVARAYQDAASAAREAATAGAAASAAAGTGLGPTFQKIGRFGVDLRALPSVQLGGGVSSDVIGKVLGSVGSGLSEVTVTASALAGPLAAVAVAMGALLVVFVEFSRQQEVAAKNIRAVIAGQQEYYDLLLNGTRAEVEAARDAALEKLAIDRAALAENQGFIQQFVQQFNQDVGNAARFLVGEGGYNALLIAIEKTNPAVGALVTEMERLQGVVKEGEIEVGRLNSLLNDNATAARDAAEAQLAQQQLVADAIQRTFLAQQEAERFASTNTVEATRERIQGLRDEVAALEETNRVQQVFNSEAANAIIDHNNALIAEKNAAINATEAVLGLSSAFEASSFFKAVQEQGRGVFEGAINAVGNAFGGVLDGAIAQVIDTTQIQAKIEEAAAKTAQAIDAINAKLAEAEAKALTDRENGLRDAITKANDAREKQEIEHRDKLLAINAKANLAQNNAIGARDALAFYQAQQTRKSELSEEARNNKRRLQEIDRALKQQTEIVTRRYNEQVEAARKAASAQIAIENQKLYVLNQQLNAEIQQINSANAARQTLNTNYWNAQLATDTAGANAGLSIVSQFWNGVLSTLSGGGGIQHSSTPIIPNVVPYDGSSGGTADYSGLTVMQSPTNTNRIAGSTSAGNTAGGGGITINVPISGAGMTKRQLLREVDQRLNTTLTRAGYE